MLTLEGYHSVMIGAVIVVLLLGAVLAWCLFSVNGRGISSCDLSDRQRILEHLHSPSRSLRWLNKGILYWGCLFPACFVLSIATVKLNIERPSWMPIWLGVVAFLACAAPLAFGLYAFFLWRFKRRYELGQKYAAKQRSRKALRQYRESK